MLGRLLRVLTFSNVCSFLALTIALGTGGAYAANTVFSSDIVDGEVRTADIATSAVNGAKLANGTVGTSDLATGSVWTQKILDGTVANIDLADNAVTGTKVAANTLTGADVDESTLVPPAETLVTSFQNGWTNCIWCGGDIGFYKFGDRVYLSGYVIGGTADTVAFTLPLGHRPASGQFFAVYECCGKPGTLYIDPNGNVQPFGTAAMLAGVSFRVGD